MATLGQKNRATYYARVLDTFQATQKEWEESEKKLNTATRRNISSSQALLRVSDKFREK